jgi:tight adherence protein C
MRATGFVFVAGVAVCAAAWLIATGWRQPKPSLERSIRHLRRPSSPLTPLAAADTPGRQPITTRVGQAAMSTIIGDLGTRWARPLRLIGRSVPAHVGMLIASALAGLVVPTLLLTTLHVLGVITIGLAAPAGLSFGAAIVVPITLHADAIARSNNVHTDLRHQLSAFLDMVTMLLAGNTGHEGALDQASRAGDGLLFRELRRRMREVATTGHSLVGALALVGDDFGVVELEQVAAAATLSAAEGAPVARTLAAKCSTLRSTIAAEQEALARVRNDKVTPPLVGMALLFMALIIYPALNLN